MMDALRAALRLAASEGMAADSAHDLAHLDRVWASCNAIAQTEPSVDKKVLMGAAYLHDLVNLPKDAPNRTVASTLAAQAAGPLLRNLGFSDGDIEGAQHAIAAHSFSANIPPQTVAARILRDADRLDALGAIGIARTFAVSGALQRPLYDPQDPFALERALDDHQWALDHWPIKLFRLPEAMLTQAGRHMAQARVAAMRGFAETLAFELGVVVPDSWG